MIFNTTQISGSENMVYHTSKRKGGVSKYHQQKYDKFTKIDTSHRKMQRKHKFTNAIVELVDIFPTIADLAGVPVPICQVQDGNYKLRLSNLTSQKKYDPCSEGITLLPLIKSTLRCQVGHLDLIFARLQKYSIKSN